MNLVEEEKDAQLTFINDNLSTEKNEEKTASLYSRISSY